MTEALDLTTPAGRAMAGLLAIFAEFEKGACGNELALDWSRPDRLETDWADQ